MGHVEGKVAFITGGASELWAADTRLLSVEGSKVVIADLQGKMGAATAASIPGALFLQHGVRDKQRWEDVVAKTLNHFGKRDVLVNNDGLVRFGTAQQATFDDFRLQMEVMVEGCFLGRKVAILHIRKTGGGSIMNVASVAAQKGISSIPDDTAGKAGIIAMSRSIAVHFQEQGYRIRVNAIASVVHYTTMTRQALAQLPEDSAGLDQVHAQGKGQPDDVANLVPFSGVRRMPTDYGHAYRHRQRRDYGMTGTPVSIAKVADIQAIVQRLAA